MKIIRTFVNGLHTFCYGNNDIDEMERLFKEWTDPEFLETFFQDHKKDLYFDNLTIEEAIEQTLDSVKVILRELKSLQHIKEPVLDTIFCNLNNEPGLKKMSKQKKAQRRLRIYAIRIDKNCFVITGGAIKASLRMADEPHTRKELQKLDKCMEYLTDNGIFDKESFDDYKILDL